MLFLWAPTPLLPEAWRVMEAWGFSYRSMIVWVKLNPNGEGLSLGMGQWTRLQNENLLIASRGDFPCPAPAARPPSVLMAPRREHSRKPDEVYRLIEEMYPHPGLPRIELFARNARPGWAAWGNEIITAA
jgi:N6-adenosine-specific RNA methylase IME4